LRILHTIETHGPGGAESVLLALAEENVEHGWAAPVGFFIKEGWLPEEFHKRGFPVTVTENRRTLDSRLIRRFARVVRSERVDLVHVHEIGMSPYAALVARALRVPLVLTVHGRNASAAARRAKRVFYGFAMRAAHVVSVSRELTPWIAHNFYLRPDRIRVIENGIDITRFDGSAPATTRRAIRRSLGIPDGAVMVISVGRLFPVKNHDLMLSAFREIARGGTDVRLVLVGDGPERAHLEEKTRRYGLGEVVRFLGERPDVPSLLGGADLFVLTSHSEGLSIAIMEAMAAGLPVVATDVGDSHVLVQDGTTGYLVESGDQTALIERMNRLVRSMELRQGMGRVGRKRVEERFSRARMWNDYEQVYARACRRR